MLRRRRALRSLPCLLGLAVANAMLCGFLLNLFFGRRPSNRPSPRLISLLPPTPATPKTNTIGILMLPLPGNQRSFACAAHEFLWIQMPPTLNPKAVRTECLGSMPALFDFVGIWSPNDAQNAVQSGLEWVLVHLMSLDTTPASCQWLGWHGGARVHQWVDDSDDQEKERRGVHKDTRRSVPMVPFVMDFHLISRALYARVMGDHSTPLSSTTQHGSIHAAPMDWRWWLWMIYGQSDSVHVHYYTSMSLSVTKVEEKTTVEYRQNEQNQSEASQEQEVKQPRRGVESLMSPLMGHPYSTSASSASAVDVLWRVFGHWAHKSYPVMVVVYAEGEDKASMDAEHQHIKTSHDKRRQAHFERASAFNSQMEENTMSGLANQNNQTNTTAAMDEDQSDEDPESASDPNLAVSLDEAMHIFRKMRPLQDVLAIRLVSSPSPICRWDVAMEEEELNPNMDDTDEEEEVFLLHRIPLNVNLSEPLPPQNDTKPKATHRQRFYWTLTISRDHDLLTGFVRVLRPEVLIHVDSAFEEGVHRLVGAGVAETGRSETTAPEVDRDSLITVIDFDRASWMQSLVMGTLSVNQWKDWYVPRFHLHVLTHRRPASLNRLLQSLLNAHYPGHVRSASSSSSSSSSSSVDMIPLTVHIDARPDTETLQHAYSLEWPHGPKDVHVRIKRGGLMQAVVEAWYPPVTEHDDTYAMILEDDVELSPLYFLWSKWMVLRYRYGLPPKDDGAVNATAEADASDYDELEPDEDTLKETRPPRLFGISLYTPRVQEMTYPRKRIRLDKRVPEPGLVRWSLPCSWGAVYFPEFWREFRYYLDQRLVDLETAEMEQLKAANATASNSTMETQNGTIPIKPKLQDRVWIPRSRSNVWKYSWKKYFIEMMVTRGYYMLYPNFPKQTSFATNHLEPGVHIGVNSPMRKLIDDFRVPLMPNQVISSLSNPSSQSDNLKQADTMLIEWALNRSRPIHSLALPVLEEIPLMNLFAENVTDAELINYGQQLKHPYVIPCPQGIYQRHDDGHVECIIVSE